MDRIKWIVFAGLALAGMVSASVTACTGQSLGTLQSAADNGNTPANGCGTVDLGFNGFLVATSGVVSGQNLNGPSANNIDITAGGLDYTLSSTGWTTGSTNSSETLGSGVSFLAVPENSQAIDGLSALSLSGFNGHGTVTITETFCLGATSAAGCNSTNQGSIDIQDHFGATLGATCGSISASFGCVANNSAGTVTFNGVTNVFVEDTVQVSHPSSYFSYTSSFSSFASGFDETAIAAEPSTFALLGTVLVGLGLLRRRRQ